MILYILQGWGRVQLPGSKVQEHCMGNNARFQFTLCFLSLFPVTYIQFFFFLLQMKVCQLRHQDAETLMTMVAARFLPGWRATKRRRRKMACVRGEVSFNRIMLWTVMNWWNLGGLLCCKLPELSCGSRWNDSGRSWCHSVAVGVRLFVCWLITLDKELGPDQHYWAPGSLLLTPLFSISWQALGQRLLLFWMDQGALSQRILKEQKHSSTRWWKHCMRSALRYSLLSSAG